MSIKRSKSRKSRPSWPEKKVFHLLGVAAPYYVKLPVSCSGHRANPSLSHGWDDGLFPPFVSGGAVQEAAVADLPVLGEAAAYVNFDSDAGGGSLASRQLQRQVGDRLTVADAPAAKDLDVVNVATLVVGPADDGGGAGHLTFEAAALAGPAVAARDGSRRAAGEQVALVRVVFAAAVIPSPPK